MYQENADFDQNSMHGGGLTQADDGFSQTHIQNQSFSLDEQSYTQNPISQQEVAAAVAAASALEMELQQHLEIEQCYSNKNVTTEIQEIDSNWQEMSGFHGENHYQNGHHHHQIYSAVSLPETTPFPTTPDLLNMLPLPRCSSSSLIPNSSITFSQPSQKSPSFLASLGLLGELNPSADGSAASASVVYDPLLPLNLPPQPPLLRELFHSLPHGGYALGGPRNGSLFGGVDEREGNGGSLYQNGDGRPFDHNGVFEFTAGEMDCVGKNRDGKDAKHFATEKHRRVLLNDKYQALRRLVPSPNKSDRASIVEDAINYINELKRTVTELKVLVEKKRCVRERLKRPKEEDAILEGNESKAVGDMDIPYNGSSLRTSWLQRKSKNTEVDVRIIDDEVTVKLVQQKRINCLLFVSKVLDELQLDLHHVAGGVIGDYYSYLFNSKICEGSIVYASAVANKLIEVVDKQYAAIPPTNSY